MAKLIDYWSLECDVCKQVAPLLDRLKKEEKVSVTKKEVTKNEANAKKMRALAGEHGCMSMPVIINSDTKKVLCGHAANNYAALKKLAGVK